MIRVGVLRGGVSSEYDISLATGKRVLTHLNRDTYTPVDILVTKDGEWNMNGLPLTLDKLRLHVDVIWNALHGHFGEDGKVQKFLDDFGIPYVGSGSLASAVTHNKTLTHEQLNRLGYKTPTTRVLKRITKDMIPLIASDIFRTIPPPWIVKPERGGSAVHTYPAFTYDELMEALGALSEEPQEVIVQEYLFGQELFTGVIEGMRNDASYTLPVFCVKSKGKIFCTEDRLGGDYAFTLARGLSEQRKKEITEHARTIHRELGLSSYSSIDFLDTPKGLYVLEVDSMPALHPHSPFSRALEALGINFEEFIESRIKDKLRK